MGVKFCYVIGLASTYCSTWGSIVLSRISAHGCLESTGEKWEWVLTRRGHLKKYTETQLTVNYCNGWAIIRGGALIWAIQYCCRLLHVYLFSLSAMCLLTALLRSMIGFFFSSFTSMSRFLARSELRSPTTGSNYTHTSREWRKPDIASDINTP